MDALLFSVGDYPVSTGLALFGTVALSLLLIGLIVLALRRDGARMLDAAQRTTEALHMTFAQQVTDRDQRIAALEQRLDEALDANATLQAEAAATRATMIEQARQSEENLQRFTSARREMSDEFKAIAADVLRTQSETFTKDNREQMDLLLKPLGDKIVEFQTGLTRDRAALGEHIQTLLSTGMTMTKEASNLARALKGNAQSQGAWGEMVLSTVLEKSGLREGEEFRRQTTHVSQDGTRRITDVEVLLPNGECIVVDSKVSLNAFDLYVNATAEEDRSQHLRAHTASLRGHIRTLSSKDYQRHSGTRLDYVLMFVPVEPAFAEAMRADPQLLEYAHAQGVYLTTPTTLMSTLRTIRNLWDVERRHQNAEQIAERAGQLYEKVVGFLGNMDTLGKTLDRARASYDDARNQLSGGKGSVVRQVELLRELGAKTGKSLPPGWSDTAVDVVPHRGEAASPPTRDNRDWLEAFEEEQPRLLAGE